MNILSILFFIIIKNLEHEVCVSRSYCGMNIEYNNHKQRI